MLHAALEPKTKRVTSKILSGLKRGMNFLLAYRMIVKQDALAPHAVSRAGMIGRFVRSRNCANFGPT
jgi:hypothetical protein